MNQEWVSTDEAILALLCLWRLGSSRQIGTELGVADRSIRRRLHRLIRDGYAFSPAHGLYRITAAGVAAIAPLPGAAKPADTPDELLERWRAQE